MRKTEKPVRYYKPDIGGLRGKVGRSIIETIRNTPKPDDTDLNRAADSFEKSRIREKQHEAQRS